VWRVRGDGNCVWSITHTCKQARCSEHNGTAFRNVQELPRPPTTHTQRPTPPYPTTGKTLAIPTPEIYLEISLVPCLVLASHEGRWPPLTH